MSSPLSGCVEVERLGGLGGFGVPGSAVRSRGVVSIDQLSASDRATVETLFARRAPAPTPLAASPADGFRYRLCWHDGERVRAVEVPETQIPPFLSACIRDELV